MPRSPLTIPKVAGSSPVAPIEERLGVHGTVAAAVLSGVWINVEPALVKVGQAPVLEGRRVAPTSRFGSTPGDVPNRTRPTLRRPSRR